MGRITTNVGLISGFPIQETVDQLMEVAAASRDRLKTRTESLTKQQTAFTDLQTVLLSLQVAVKKFTDPKIYTARTVTSSSTALSAVSVGTPPLGNYTFTPVRMASSHQLMSSKLSSDTAPLGSGKFSFSFGGFVNKGQSLDLTNSGDGFQRGKIRITDRSGASAEIDLSLARTADDVLQAINENSTIQVRAEFAGDKLRLIDRTGLAISNLRVAEVGAGTTAASLGLAGIDVASSQAEGADIVSLFSDLSLNALNGGGGIRFDDGLDDLRISLRDGSQLTVDFARMATPGTKASATTPGTLNVNSKLTFTAVEAGSASAGVTISFVDDPSVTAGSETVAYDENAKSLTFRIDSGATTANNIIAALEREPAAAAKFTVKRPPSTSGTGLISLGDSAVTMGPQATATTTAANGVDAKIKFIAVQGGAAMDDVEIVFEDNPAVTAGNETVTFDTSDPDNRRLVFQINEGGTTADNIIQALSNDPTASALFTASRATGSNGSGLVSTADSGLTSGGALLEATSDLTETTLGDVLATINSVDPTKLRADISADGDRIVLTDLTADNGGTFEITQLNGSRAAEDLGLTLQSQNGVVTGQRVIGGLGTSLLRNLNGGRGMELGQLDLTDRSGATASIDLSDAETLDEVVERINAAGVGISASVNQARNGIQLTDTTGQTASNLIVASGDSLETAEQLGLEVNDAVITKNSGSLRLQTVNENTKLASLNGGGGVASGTFNIVDSNGKSATVNVNSAITTVGDLIDRMNSLGLAIDARINDSGDGIALVDTGGGTDTLRVAEGNRTTAANLHLIGAAKTVDIDGQPTQVLEGSSTFTFDIDEDDSLRDLVSRINAAGLKVSAAVLNDGSSIKPYRFTLTSGVTGEAGELLIDSSQAGFSLSETSRAQDALLLYGSSSISSNSILASSSTGVFRELVEGLSLTVKEPSDKPAVVSVASSSTDLVATVQASVDIINRLHKGIKDITVFDVEANKKGLLQGDGAVLRIENDLANLLSGRFFGAGTIHSLQEIGVNMKEDGSVELDSEKLKLKIAEDPGAVEEFLSAETFGLSAKLNSLTEQLAGSNTSLLANKFDSFERRITSNNAKIEFYNERLDRQRELLLRQFQQMELAIGKWQNTQSAINSIAAIPPLTVSRQ